jgi:hypothetical protein
MGKNSGRGVYHTELRPRENGSGPENEEKDFEIGRVLHFKLESGKLKSDFAATRRARHQECRVRFELSTFQLEMQDSSDFEI